MAQLAALLLAAGCPSRCAQEDRASPASARHERPATSAAAEASSSAAKLPYVHCTRLPKLETLAKPLTIAGSELVLKDGALVPGQPPDPASAKPLILGVLADLKQASPANLTQLETLASAFLREGAAAALLLGGADPTYEGTLAILARLAQRLPVLALPGDRVSAAGFRAAAENVAGTVVDLTRVRAVLLPGASIVGLGGYGWPHHLQAQEQGCSYDDEDLRQLAAQAATLPAPRVLLSYGPPRGSGQRAPDRALGQLNIGDPRIDGLLTRGAFAVGLFGHVQEAAGLATTLLGQPVAAGDWSASLLLQVGSADQVRHEDLSGNWSRGTAALLELAKDRVRFRLLHGPAW